MVSGKVEVVDKGVVESSEVKRCERLQKALGSLAALIPRSLES